MTHIEITLWLLRTFWLRWALTAVGAGACIAWAGYIVVKLRRWWAWLLAIVPVAAAVWLMYFCHMMMSGW